MLQTPYYLIDKTRLKKNMEVMARLRHLSGAKVLLALKCFACWSVFDLMREFMDGTTSSSLYELRLGAEKFGGETHAYSVAWDSHEIKEAVAHADKIIFNSINQLTRFYDASQSIERGLRLNPQLSSSHFDLADPARPFSRLGEWNKEKIDGVMDKISGFMIHNNCENADFALLEQMFAQMEEKFGSLFAKAKWISFGGGIHFTGDDYPLEKLAALLKDFAARYNVSVYLEPGEAAITNSTSLEVTVLDRLNNGKELAIVDASIEAHMLDLLIYRESAKIAPDEGAHEVMICGKSCLAGDIFGTFHFPKPVEIGDRISILDAGGYTMVKKNWFNGVNMPAIAVREFDGTLHQVRSFSYEDYLSSLS